MMSQVDGMVIPEPAALLQHPGWPSRTREAPMSYAALALRAVGCSILLAGSLTVSGCHQRRVAAPGRPAAGDEVNVGYGTAKQQDVTGAISSLREEDLPEDRSGGMEKLLQSKLPGVRVIRSRGGDLSLQIRGRDNALVMVDGAPLRPGDLDRINPYDIQRLDVLRDVASSAIYGARGVNGVVLITTRRPR